MIFEFFRSVWNVNHSEFLAGDLSFASLTCIFPSLKTNILSLAILRQIFKICSTKIQQIHRFFQSFGNSLGFYSSKNLHMNANKWTPGKLYGNHQLRFHVSLLCLRCCFHGKERWERKFTQPMVDDEGLWFTLWGVSWVGPPSQ